MKVRTITLPNLIVSISLPKRQSYGHTHMIELQSAGCRTFYINGSFVTDKATPKDFDCCWDRDDVNIEYLREKAPLILKYYDSAAQKAKYGGEIYPSDQPVDDSLESIELFKRDRRKKKKGIIAIDLREWAP